MNINLLIIDDDVELCELLSEYLTSEGFNVTCVHDGEAGVQTATSSDYDLIILDVMLPKIEGFEVLRQIQQQLDVPVLMLTARGDDINRIIGLEIGADDYLPKPCNPRELVARIKAILRRTKSNAVKDKSIIHIDDLTLKLDSYQVYKNDVLIELTHTEYKILTYLCEHAGRVINKNTLTEKTLGRNIEAYDRSIDMHISNLRAKLGKKTNNKPYIKTVRGVGYIYENSTDA